MRILRSRGFTLVEVIIVVVIISILSGFGITNYYKSQERAKRMAAESNLKLISRAQQTYFARYDTFFPPSGGGDKDVEDIKEGLKLFMNDQDFTYSCDDILNDNSFSCEAVRKVPSASVYTLTVTDATGPVCSGACP